MELYAFIFSLTAFKLDIHLQLHPIATMASTSCAMSQYIVTGMGLVEGGEKEVIYLPGKKAGDSRSSHCNDMSDSAS